MFKNLSVKMAFTSITAALILTGCGQNEVQQSANNDQIKQEAKNAIMTVGGTLKKNLKQKIKEGGFANAANFCSMEAGNLAKEAAKTLPNGVTIKRITDKPRNMYNEATDEQLKVLEEIKTQMEKGKLPQMVVKQKTDNHFQVYKPLVIEKPCLKCHGADANRDVKAYEIISKKYPNDKATGYKLGELRGAFLVNIIK